MHTKGVPLDVTKFVRAFLRKIPSVKQKNCPKPTIFGVFGSILTRTAVHPSFTRKRPILDDLGPFSSKKEVQMGPAALRLGSGQIFLACDKAFKHNSTRNCAPTELEKQFGRPPIDFFFVLL